MNKSLCKSPKAKVWDHKVALKARGGHITTKQVIFQETGAGAVHEAFKGTIQFLLCLSTVVK